MEEQEENELLTTQVKAGLGIVAVGAVWYYVSTRKERKKRKSIQDWKVMNIDAINASQRRLLRVLENPNVTEAEFRKAWNEEQAFMTLIHDQPMY